MISKAVRGKGFSGAVSYVCEKATTVRTLNIASQDWKLAAREMRLVARMNRTEKCCYHHWLSFDPVERLDDEAMFKAAALMIEKLGLSEHQHVMAVHEDRDHKHVHIVSNLVGFDGRAQKLSHDFRARPVYAREIEKELSLKTFERKERSANPVSAERIEQIKIALQSAKSEDDLRHRLDQIGVSMTEKSSRQNAVNFRLIDSQSGAIIPGSKINAAMSSPASLKKHFSSSKPEQKSAWNESRNTTVQRAAAAAKSWADLRKNLKDEGLNFEIITRANGNQGLVFVDENGNRIAASKIAADLSYGRLQKLFDQPQPSPQTQPQAAPPPPKQKKPWEQYNEARSEHFCRIGKSPEQIKADLETIKKSKEKLWKEYRYKTSLIPQCFEPKYRGMMRAIERESFEKSKLRLEKQAQHLREQRFVSFDSWKLGAIKPTPTPQKQTIFQKLKVFFFPIASASEKYHQKNTYHPKPQSSATRQIEIISHEDFNLNDILKEASLTGTEQLKVVSSNYTNQLRPSMDKSTRSNSYVTRNHDQR